MIGQMLEKRGRCVGYKIAALVCMITLFNSGPSSIAWGFSSSSSISSSYSVSRNGYGLSYYKQQYRTGVVSSSGNVRLYNSKSDGEDGLTASIEETKSEEEEEEEKKLRLKEEGVKRRQKMMDELEKEKRTNIGVAVFSVLAAVLNFAYQLFHPVTELQLLVAMQDQSSPLTTIGRNGKPTVVDFWAPWCDNCKSFAPTLQSIEAEYSDRVNFVMINGDEGANWPLINRFGVDAIPHMALISADGTIETALIGPVPKSVMSIDLDVLLQNAKTNTNNDKTVINTESDSLSSPSPPTKIELPYTMFDAFQNKPELRHITFDE